MTNIFSALDVKFFSSLLFDPWFISLVLLLSVLFDFYSFGAYSLVSVFNYLFQGVSLFSFSSYYTISYIVFFFFFFFNGSGIFPYFFGVSSHLFGNLLFSLLVYFNLFMYSLRLDLVGYFTHFVPFGSGYLSFFLFFVEFLSYWVRIVTLTLRVSVNMTAGHVFLHLLGSSFSFTFNILLLFIALFYILFESFVCVIQASVYCLLVNSYVSDK